MVVPPPSPQVLALEEATLLEAVLDVLGVARLAALAADMLGITLAGTTETKEVVTKDGKKEAATKEAKVETAKTVVDTEGKTAKK